ncbi:MAG TPA: FGGY family carbohydrate kinase, partial [Candidatus Limnocylindrales bacterium]
ARLLWFRRHQPATARRARTWVGVAELVGHALTGRLATNASLACRTMAFDVRSRTWDASLIALAGFHTDLMPPLLPLGREVGGIAPEAATRHRIQAGTPVAIAGHDHLVGAIGAGVVRPGQALDSIGSAEAAMLVLDRATADAAIGAAGFSVGCHAVDGRSYVIGGLQASGSFVDWVRRSILDLDRDGGYAQFDALLALAPPGPSDIVAGPWLAGRSVPNPNRTIGASFAGLRPEHGRSDLALAAVEAVAFASRWIFDELEAVTGRRIARVRVIGGGSRNQRWLGVKRATMPWRLELADDDETVARGAALVGGLAGGAYGSVREAIARAGAPVRPVPIDRRLRTAYEAAYRERFLPFAIRT